MGEILGRTDGRGTRARLRVSQFGGAALSQHHRRDTDAVVRPLPLSSRPDRHAAALNQRRTAHHGLCVLGARACAGKLSRLLLLIVISRLLTAISKPLTAI